MGRRKDDEGFDGGKGVATHEPGRVSGRGRAMACERAACREGPSEVLDMPPSLWRTPLHYNTWDFAYVVCISLLSTSDLYSGADVSYKRVLTRPDA